MESWFELAKEHGLCVILVPALLGVCAAYQWERKRNQKERDENRLERERTQSEHADRIDDLTNKVLEVAVKCAETQALLAARIEAWGSRR